MNDPNHAQVGDQSQDNVIYLAAKDENDMLKWMAAFKHGQWT